MYKILWTTKSEKDFLEIIKYYKEEVSKNFALKFRNMLMKKIKSLENFPNRTRVLRVKWTREFIINYYPYVVVIKVDDKNKNVIILNIIHTSKKFP